MQIYEMLLTAAGVVGAITTLFLFGKKIVKAIRNGIKFFNNMNTNIKQLSQEQGHIKREVFEIKQELADTKKEVEKISRHTHENYMRELQIIIMSDEMPLGERLCAGEEYIREGGNGEIKAKYKLLQHEYEEHNDKHSE